MTNRIALRLSSSSVLDQDDCIINIDNECLTMTIDDTNIITCFDVGPKQQNHCLSIQKNVDDRKIIKLESISVDDIYLPRWLLHDHGTFFWHGQQHQGSMEWYPAGTWQFCFATPLLTWILDQKILHEARYNQDYLYPWSYRLGPDSVKNLGSKIHQTFQKVERTL